MNIKELNNQNFNESVLSNDNIVLVDFWAPWCGPCRMLAPVLEELASEVKENVEICKLNVDENRELVIKYNISAIPAVLIFKEGKLVKQIIGLKDKDYYINELNNL